METPKESRQITQYVQELIYSNTADNFRNCI